MQSQSQLLQSQDGIEEKNSQIQLVQEIRCRICYSDFKPLISLCECSGSMAYVHQQCILDWIRLKMERYEGLRLPECEICRMPYSARLRLGSRKICQTTLLLKLGLLSLRQKYRSIYYIIGTILCTLLILRLIIQFLVFTYGVIFNDDFPQWTRLMKEEPFISTFTHIILPCSFLREAINHFLRFRRLIEQCYIQVIEFIIEPKEVIR